jgi:hypothetical protein
MVGTGLAGVVGGAGTVGGVLREDLVRIERKIAVDLAGADVVEAGDTHLPGRFEKGLGPDHVGTEEQSRVEHGQAVVRLGGEVDDRIDALVT